MFREEHFIILAGFMSQLAYELHDKDYIDDDLGEDLLMFWRMFNGFEDEYLRMKRDGELNNFV